MCACVSGALIATSQACALSEAPGYGKEGGGSGERYFPYSCFLRYSLPLPFSGGRGERVK